MLGLAFTKILEYLPPVGVIQQYNQVIYGPAESAGISTPAISANNLRRHGAVRMFCGVTVGEVLA